MTEQLEPIISDDVVWGKAYYEMHEVDAIIAQKNKEIAELKAMPHTDNSDVIDKMATEIAKLEEERRWRKCSEELPEEGVEVLVTNGIDCGISDWCGDYWNNDPFCGYTVCDNVIAWMPLPKAPEVE